MYGAPSQLGLLSLDLVFSHTRVSFWPAEMKAYHVRVCACLCIRERQSDQCKLCNSSLGVIFFSCCCQSTLLMFFHPHINKLRPLLYGIGFTFLNTNVGVALG